MKKVLSILFSALLLSTFSSGVAHAEVAEDFSSMKSGNTWIELEEANTDIFGDSKIAAVPKGVLKPEGTKIRDAIKKIGGQDAVDQTQYFSYSTGIHSDDGKPALSPLLKMLKEYKPESATDDPAVPMTDNPMFYGDLSYNDDTTSKNVKISAGDNLSSLKLTLSNMNWLSQPIFSELSGHDMYRSEKANGTLRFLTDSQLVYTIKFPKGFDISKATATSDASSDLLTLSTSVSGEVKTGMTLTVTLRRKGAGETFLTEDQFKNELNSLNTISVSMKDIAITKDAVQGKNVVTGSIGGFLEYMNVGGSTYDEVRQNKGLTWTYIHYFAAPQEASGKDSNLTANDSQYKIQYTFNVVKPAQSTVTFKDGDKTHATVKVETGKAIDTDALTDESMPKSPTKAGYTFKEWNTKEDGKGTAFTGASIVNSDMTVYAIYTKDPVPTPDPTPNPPAPNPDPTPNPPAPTPEPTPNPPTPELKPNPQTPAPGPETQPESTPTPDSEPESQSESVSNTPVKKHGEIPKAGESTTLPFALTALGLGVAGLGILRKKRMMKENIK
ncbi:InlB B-repeat-containing protein [Gardnerella leopoldii]|uniref:InlB B-repeat-containing protein n=1 Tax=Gardnerella leopoldii TaxID=2792978 RepID=UPI00157478B7|nr:InlB B-repeat-containing protein [Gardnerella vaginalis]